MAFKEVLDPRFSDYQKQVLENSRTMARVLTERGLRIDGNIWVEGWIGGYDNAGFW